jgi:CheY-like chemotaxis protein
MKTRVLIIDDEPEYSSMLKAHLQSQGYYEVAEENDETRAIAAAREFAPDLILLDVMMPNLEGSEVAAMIRKNPQLRETPILFLTALVSEADAPCGSYLSGGNVFLPKSLPIDRLMDCIAQSVGDARGDMETGLLAFRDA